MKPKLSSSLRARQLVPTTWAKLIVYTLTAHCLANLLINLPQAGQALNYHQHRRAQRRNLVEETAPNCTDYDKPNCERERLARWRLFGAGEAQLLPNQTTPTPNLIARTSDAIYQALTGYFTHDLERIESKPKGANSTTVKPTTSEPTRNATTSTTTRAPTTTSMSTAPPPTQKARVTTTTTTTRRPASSEKVTLQPHLNLDKFKDSTLAPSTTTTTTQKPITTSTQKPQAATTTRKPNDKLKEEMKPADVQENSIEFFSLLNRAVNSMYSINEMTYLNRTTRVAHESEAPTSLQAEVVENFRGEREDAGERPEAQKLQQVVATRDDILLLCKLLHKQLESGILTSLNGTISTNSISNHSISRLEAEVQKTTTTTTTTTTPKPARNLLAEFLLNGLTVSDPQIDLNETRANLLIESIFALERRAATTTMSDAAYEHAAHRLLADLYNAGFRRKFGAYLRESTGAGNTSTSVSDMLSDDPQVNQPEVAPQAPPPLGLRLWSKTLTGAGGSRGAGRLRLVYWLVVAQQPGNTQRFRVLSADEAAELIDQLEHALIEQTIQERALVRPIQLVGAHNSDKPATGSGSDALPVPAAPHVIDDNLNGKQSAQPQKKSDLESFVDKLFRSSFSDNLHLYLSLLLLLILLVVLCFAIPMICTKACGQSGSRSTMGQHSGNGALNGNGAGNFHSNGQTAIKTKRRNGQRQARRGNALRYPTSSSTDHILNGNNKSHIPSISSALADRKFVQPDDYLEDYDDDDEQMQQTSGTINEAIWTKLSNSTTTLTKDRTRTMYDEGQVSVPILSADEAAARAAEHEKVKRYEWYTFEDKTSTTHTTKRANKHDKQTQNDRNTMTKSVQTCKEPAHDEQRRANVEMSFSDRYKTRNSDTLTKSELVMLKEKLIPIGRQEENASDYVNQPKHFIDSSAEDSNGQALAKPSELAASEQSQQDQRTATMRYLELPGGNSKTTQAKVEAIKSELERVEARDARLAPGGSSPGTYKRYDVI